MESPPSIEQLAQAAESSRKQLREYLGAVEASLEIMPELKRVISNAVTNAVEGLDSQARTLRRVASRVRPATSGTKTLADTELAERVLLNRQDSFLRENGAPVWWGTTEQDVAETLGWWKRNTEGDPDRGRASAALEALIAEGRCRQLYTANFGFLPKEYSRDYGIYVTREFADKALELFHQKGLVNWGRR